MNQSQQIQYLVIAAVAVSVFLLASEPSQAGLLPSLSGNHRAVAESIGDLDASFSFAVFEIGGVSGDAFGTGFSGFDTTFTPAIGTPSQLDTSAKYLYLYQYVNDGPGTREFELLVLPTNSITSLGTWNWGFQDADGIVDAGNPLGTNGANFESAASPVLGVLSGRVVDTANTMSEVDKVPELSFADGAVNAEFNLEHLEATTVFGFTSNAPPVIQHVTAENCLDDFACGGFVRPLNADFDGDGDVDGADLDDWQADFGKNGSDADGDGDSDGADFLAWQQQFTGNSGLALATTVPEPSTTVMILAVLGSLAASWRGCQSR